MPLPGVCPSCGAAFDLPAALTDAEARQALAAALDMPERLARLIPLYIALHGPTSGRRMQWAKLSRLLRELGEMIKSGAVSRNGIDRAAPLKLWQESIEQVLASRDAGTLSLPLDGHGYLEAIAWRRAAAMAGKTGNQTEHTRRRNSDAPRTENGPRKAGDIARSVETRTKGLDAAKRLKESLSER